MGHDFSEVVFNAVFFQRLYGQPAAQRTVDLPATGLNAEQGGGVTHYFIEHHHLPVPRGKAVKILQ